MFAQKLMNYMMIQIKYQFSVGISMNFQYKKNVLNKLFPLLKRILNLRGFQGELKFDISKKTMDMEVLSRDKESTQNGCRTTNLSGGERSYVTVALLMSLWSCVRHPFFFLDEYDVFTVQTVAMTSNEAVYLFVLYFRITSIDPI